jgi:hypothetical protein
LANFSSLDFSVDLLFFNKVSGTATCSAVGVVVETAILATLSSFFGGGGEGRTGKGEGQDRLGGMIELDTRSFVETLSFRGLES